MKDRRQQLVGDNRVHASAGGDEIVQPRLLLDDDQNADVARRQLRGNSSDLVDQAVDIFLWHERELVAPKLHASHLLQGVAQFRVKEDDQRDRRQRHNLPHEPVEGLEVEEIREHVDQ